MVKIITSKVKGEKKDRAQVIAGRVTAVADEPESIGTRFTGRPSASGDRRLIEEATSMAEPQWSLLRMDQLKTAERMALHRISGGETSWKGVLSRIRAAISSKS